MRPNQPDSGKTKRVVIYSAPWCAVCKRAKQFLQNKGIPFRELDIEKNRMAQRELERMNAIDIAHENIQILYFARSRTLPRW